MIAAVLALAVDPFLKEKLLEDVSKGLFEHMIGFDHEPGLTAEIKKIALETKLYQRDYALICHIEPHEERYVKVTMSKELEILNPSLESVEFKPGWRFSEADAPSNCKVQSFIDDQECPEIAVDFRPDGTGYSAAYAPTVSIEPGYKNQRCRFIATCSAIQPIDWYHPFYFVLPTIDVRITVRAPEGWRVWIGGHEPQFGVASYHKNKLLMLGDKLEVHWRSPKQTDPC